MYIEKKNMICIDKFETKLYSLWNFVSPRSRDSRMTKKIDFCHFISYLVIYFFAKYDICQY